MVGKSLVPLLILCLAAACGSATAIPAATEAPAGTPTASPAPGLRATETTPPATETPTPAFTPTPLSGYPPEGYGPQFPSDVDPLTGLKPANTALLERRPLAIKISNVPRNIRPQWGLNEADLVFDYYTEAGGTRFIAVYYGQDASRVGPVRSARFFDAYVVRGYKAVFAFGGAWTDVLVSLQKSDFKTLLVTEGMDASLIRYEPAGRNLLVADTAGLSAYITRRRLPNGRQDLNGMFFQLQAPAGGQAFQQVYLRYSAASYDRWDYDPSTARYYRYEDSADDPNLGQSEQYAQLTDALSGQPVAFDNVVVLYVNSVYYKQAQPGKNEVMDIKLTGGGQAYVFRNGQGYPATWKRGDTGVVTLYDQGGAPLPLKPGTTCFEVIGLASSMTQTGQTIRFTNHMP